jgi:hypothetical protein
MQGYYARLERLRGRLVVSGQGNWAMALLSAQRSASTSADALFETGVVLKRLLDSKEPDLGDFRDEAQTIYEESDRLWWDIGK